MAEILLQVENLCKSYAIKGLNPFAGKRRIGVLDGMSFSVSGGEIKGVVGRNGAGKTTLLRIVADLLKADSGRYGFGQGFDYCNDFTVGMILASIAFDGKVDGYSFREVAEGGSDKIRDYAFMEYAGGAMEDCFAVVSNDGYKYYETSDGFKAVYDLKRDGLEQRPIEDSNFIGAVKDWLGVR